MAMKAFSPVPSPEEHPHGSDPGLGCPEPWLAVHLSHYWPGLGHVRVGDWQRGALIMTITALLFWGGIGLLLSDAPRGGVLGLLAVNGAPLFGIWSLFDAHRTARSRGSEAWQADRRKSPDPWLAIFLNGLLIGAGHYYLRQRWLAFSLLCLGTAGLVIPPLVPWIILIITPIAALHLYLTTPERYAIAKTPPKTLLILAQVLLVSLILPVLFLAINRGVDSQLMEIRTVSSPAMLPTLDMGEQVVIDKWVYQKHLPQRGEVIALKTPGSAAQPRPSWRNGNRSPEASPTTPTPGESPDNPSNSPAPDSPAPDNPAPDNPAPDNPAPDKPNPTARSPRFNAVVRRIVGLPGETLKIEAGQVWINERPLQESSLLEPIPIAWGPITIPADQYFVLGDNRRDIGKDLEIAKAPDPVRAPSSLPQPASQTAPPATASPTTTATKPQPTILALVPKSRVIGRVSQRVLPLERSGPIR